MKRALIFHNILWSRYKADIFSCLNAIAIDSNEIKIEFVQIAETETGRVSIGAVDFSRHVYPFELLFKGCYEDTSNLKIAAALALKILRFRGDIVVLPGYHSMEHWAALASAMMKKRKIAVFCDSTSLERKKNLIKSALKGFFFRRCDAVFVYGTRSSDYVRSFGVDEKRIYSDCQASRLLPTYSKDRARILRETSQDGEIKKIIYVGRLSAEKGIKDLLGAALNLLTQGCKLQVELIGSGPDEPALRDLISSAGISEHVRLLGPASPVELERIYASASILVLPSLVEPWGLVVNEALSYGCAVVVSDKCGCVPELVIPQVTGESYSSGNINDLTACIRRVLKGLENGLYSPTGCMSHADRFSPENAAARIYSGLSNLTRETGS